MSPYDLALQAWNTYLMDTYTHYTGEQRPTYASKWRKSNPGNHDRLVAYKNGTGPRPTIKDGYGPIIVAIVDLMRACGPAPEPTPPPGPIAPRTFNAEGGSDARFCVRDLPRDPARGNIPYDIYTHYDGNGLDVDGGRTKDTQVPGLRGAKQMDQYGPCDLYPPLTEWPKESYDR